MSEENTAFGYNAKGVISILHNSFRFGGDSTFKLPLPADQFVNGGQATNFDEFANSQEATYYQGLLSAGILLMIFMVIWFCTLPCLYCCRPKCYGNGCKTVVFFVALGFSTLGWFLSISGNGFFIDGTDNGVGQLEKLSQDMIELANDLNGILNEQNNYATIRQSIIDECDPLLQQVGASFSGSDIPESDVLTILGEPRDIASDIGPVFTDASSDVDPTVESIATAYRNTTVWVIIFLLIWGVTTVFAIMFDTGRISAEKNWAMQLNSFINTLGCCLIFTVGLLFVIMVIIFCAMLSTVATLGADLCSPDLSQVLLGEFQKALPPGTDSCELDDFNSLDELEQVASFVCHYSTCQGKNIIFDAANIETNVVNGELEVKVEALEDIKVQLLQAQIAVAAARQELIDNNQDPALVDDCAAAVDDIETLFNSFNDFATAGIKLVSCENLTPLYRGLVDDSTCNGLVAGMGVIYITWTMGAIGMMIAMSAYVLLEFGPKDEYALDAYPQPQQATEVKDDEIEYAQEVKAQPYETEIEPAEEKRNASVEF